MSEPNSFIKNAPTVISYETMGRPAPTEPQRVISFQVKVSADERVREIASSRGLKTSALYREILRLGMTEYMKGRRSPEKKE